MHILITADAVGGVWTYARELVSGLAKRGHRVTLVTFGKVPSAPQASWLQGLPGVEFHPATYSLEWMQDAPGKLESSIRYLEALIGNVRPDVLHSNQYCYGTVQCEIPRLLVAHSDVLTWWQGVHGRAAEETSWLTWYRDTVNRGLVAADFVVAPSRWMLEALTANYSFETRRRVIYNGRSPDLFRTTDKKNCVLSVGRVWDQAKQTSLLLEQKQAVPVCIAGTQDHPELTFRNTAAWQQHGGTVQFCGEQTEEQLRALYAGCSTYVATSRYEPFGLAPVEAAFSSCALVANDIPVFREVWGDAATYFQKNDADSLAARIQTLAENTEEREELGNRAYARALNSYTAERMVDEYEELYRELTTRSVPR